MFFILSKLLSVFVHPFTWILLVLLYAYRTKNPVRKKRSLITATVAVFFFTNTVIFSEFARLWEPDGFAIEEISNHDVAVVLGGMAEFDNSRNRLSLRRGGDRIWQALHLYHLGKVDKIMIVGANGDLVDKGLNEGQQFKQVLLDFGIPESDLLIEDQSKNTYQNAQEAYRIIQTHPEISTTLLVTSALHAPRAEACFEKAGFVKFTTFTTDHYTGISRGYTFDQYLLPNITVMGDWSKLIHEWVGYVSYWMMGYI